MHAAAVEVFAEGAVPVEAADDLEVALELAERLAGDGDGVLVTGSLLTVGAARDRYLPVSDPGDEVVYEPEDLDEDDGDQTPLELLEERHDRETFQDALDRVLDDR
jgi:dihydrofolate synthase / folylpolyglutamate synthase